MSSIKEEPQICLDQGTPMVEEENGGRTVLSMENITTLTEFVNSLPSGQQVNVRFWCMDIDRVPIARRLKGLEAHLTAEQLEICRRLLEEECSDFKKFLPKSQHKIVDQFIVKKDFASVRDLITAADLPAALEAYENYLKYNKIEISVTSSVDEDDSETTVINDKKSADAINTEELPEGNGEREEEEQRELNTPRCFDFLEGETDEIVHFVYSTIKTRNYSAKKKDQLILSCLSDENKQKYQSFRDELTTTISMDFGSFSKQKSIRLKKLLLGGSSPVKVKGLKWLSRLSKEEVALEVAIVLMNNMLQQRLEIDDDPDNNDKNKQLVLYNAKEAENRESKRERKIERDNKRKLKAKRPNILKRFWRLVTTAAKLFRNYFHSLNCKSSGRRSTIRLSRGSAILYRRWRAPSVQSQRPLIEY